MDMQIVATLDTPVIGDLGPLDAQLAWAAWQEAERDGVELPPITDDHVHDFDLPLETWTRGDYWGWCVSSPTMDTPHHSATEIRRRPATEAMAAYTTAKEHHSGLGPMKARNVTLGASHHTTVTWHADVTDLPRLQELLSIITHLGARHRNGYGHVTSWRITDGAPDGWENRPMPSTHGVVQRVRAPYWHPTERTQCS